MAFSIVLLLGLIIVPALLAGIIILLVKGGSAVRWFFGILLLLLVMGLFVLYYEGVQYHPSVERSQSFFSDSQLQGATAHIDKHPTVWAGGLEEELTPDVYSSIETAAYGLAVQLKETVDQLSQAPKKITIYEGGDNDLTLLENFRRGLQFILPDTGILIASDSPSEKPTDENIRITVKHHQNPPVEITIPEINNGDHILMSQILDAGNQRGSLQAVIQTTDNKFAKQVEYDYRSWLQNADSFRSQVGRGEWAIIATDDTTVSQEQAREQVIIKSAAYLSEQLRRKGLPNMPVLQTDLKDYGFIVDEYDQRLQGMSGPIWRSALLLDVSADRISKLRQNKKAINQVQRKTWIFHIISLAGMLALISVLYLFVNAITKGYYTTKILFVSVLVFLLFVLFLFLH